MLIPVRCFTCGKCIGQLWKSYVEKVAENNDTYNGEALDHVGLTRYCCRSMFLGHINIIDVLLEYPNNPGEKNDLNYTDVIQDVMVENIEELEYTYIEDE